MRNRVSAWPWQRESRKYWEMGWQRPSWITIVLGYNFIMIILDGIIQILRIRLLLIIVSGGSFWLLKQIIGQGIPLWPGGWGFYEWLEILTVRIGTWPLPGEREEIGDPKTKKSDLVRTLQEVSFIWTLESYIQYSWLYLSFYFWASNKQNEYKM